MASNYRTSNRPSGTLKVNQHGGVTKTVGVKRVRSDFVSKLGDFIDSIEPTSIVDKAPFNLIYIDFILPTLKTAGDACDRGRSFHLDSRDLQRMTSIVGTWCSEEKKKENKDMALLLSSALDTFYDLQREVQLYWRMASSDESFDKSLSEVRKAIAANILSLRLIPQDIQTLANPTLL